MSVKKSGKKKKKVKKETLAATSSTVFGVHAVEALLKNFPKKISLLSFLKDAEVRLRSLEQLAQQAGIACEYRSRQQLDELVVCSSHQGVVAQLSGVQEVFDEDYLKKHLLRLLRINIAPFILVLDGVTDPHNLGACLRTAEAAGVQFLIVPKDNAATLNAAAAKVACGAANVLPLIRVTNLVRTLRWLQEQGVWLVGAEGESDVVYYKADLKGPLAIVMGSEGTGLRRLTRETCDSLIKVPMAGVVSSLNVSVATGVCLFEAVRQRLQN